MIRALILGASLAFVTPQQAFRGTVDSVELDVAVTQGNKPIAGLVAADFDVTDNGVRQTILEVSRERQPIDVVMVVDLSSSVAGDLLKSLANAVNAVRRRLRDDDRVEIVTFNSQVLERVAMAPAPQVTAVALGRAMGSTSLNDAIIVSLAAPPEVGRRRMAIVFTDGYDTSSFLGESDVLDVAGRSRTAIFAVSTSSSGKRFFDELAGMTGGIMQIVPPSTTSRDFIEGTSVVHQLTYGPSSDVIDDSFLRALEDFRTSYVVRYSLNGVARPGWHEVVVKVTKSSRYQVRAKKGYTF